MWEKDGQNVGVAEEKPEKRQKRGSITNAHSGIILITINIITVFKNINFSYTIAPQQPNYLQKMFCNKALTPKSPSRLGFIFIKRW